MLAFPPFRRYRHLSACEDAYIQEERGRYEPTSAAWIMLTSLPPSPIQQTRFLVNLRIRRATSAFWVGEHRQATTAESFVAISMNSFLNILRQSYQDRQLYATPERDIWELTCSDSPSITRQQSSLFCRNSSWSRTSSEVLTTTIR